MAVEPIIINPSTLAFQKQRRTPYTIPDFPFTPPYLKLAPGHVQCWPSHHTRFPSNFDFLILSLAKVSSDQRLERRKAKQLGAEK